MATSMFKVVAVRPASDADRPVRVTLPENLQGASVTQIVRHVLHERNVPLSDRDLTTRIQGEMGKEHGFTLNGRAVTEDYTVAPTDYVERTAPDGKTQYHELDLIVAAKQKQGYQ